MSKIASIQLNANLPSIGYEALKFLWDKFKLN